MTKYIIPRHTTLPIITTSYELRPGETGSEGTTDNQGLIRGKGGAVRGLNGCAPCAIPQSNTRRLQEKDEGLAPGQIHGDVPSTPEAVKPIVVCKHAPKTEEHLCWNCLQIKPCMPFTIVSLRVTSNTKYTCLDCLGFNLVLGDMEEDKRPGIVKPQGHKFFPDCQRESTARMIEWASTRKGIYTWFDTKTFKWEVSNKRAHKILNRWLSRLNQAVIDKSSGRSRLSWVCATEWQQRGVIHFHSLLMGSELSLLSRKSWESRWEHEGGGISRLYNAVGRAAPYLAKYCSKGLGGEVEWGGAWQGHVSPASVDCARAHPGVVYEL